MKFIVNYTLPYEHQVLVGIEADDQETAIARAEALFNQGEIWDDTAEVPLLLDLFIETEDASIPLVFTIEGEVTDDWPAPDASVIDIRRQNAAFEATRLLTEAYRLGEKIGGNLDRNKLDQAYQAALKASP